MADWSIEERKTLMGALNDSIRDNLQVQALVTHEAREMKNHLAQFVEYGHRPVTAKQPYFARGGEWDGRPVMSEKTEFRSPDGSRYILRTDSNGVRNWVLVKEPVKYSDHLKAQEDWAAGVAALNNDTANEWTSSFLYESSRAGLRIVGKVLGVLFGIPAALVAVIYLMSEPGLQLLAYLLTVIICLVTAAVMKYRGRRARHRRLIADADYQHAAWLAGDDKTAYLGRYAMVGPWRTGESPLSTEWMTDGRPTPGLVPRPAPPAAKLSRQVTTLRGAR